LVDVAADSADAAVRVQVIRRPGTRQVAQGASEDKAAEADGDKSLAANQTAQIQTKLLPEAGSNKRIWPTRQMPLPTPPRSALVTPETRHLGQPVAMRLHQAMRCCCRVLLGKAQRLMVREALADSGVRTQGSLI
jgi:hypothetical protein